MKKVALGAAVALLSLMSFGVHEVSTTAALVEAITAINNGDSDNTIRLAAGTYDVSGCNMSDRGCLFVSRNVVIEGADTTSWRTADDRNAKAILDAKEMKSVIELSTDTSPNATFRHLTILNGRSTWHGAGICNGWYSGKYAVCTNCVFRNNTAEGQNQGGGGHTLTLRDCYFTNNVAREGGAVLSCNEATNCRFEYNRATGNGGALRNGGNVSRCVFIGNVGGTSSCNYGSTCTMTDCVCISNSAAAGGCFAAENIGRGHRLTVVGCTFEGNRNTAGNSGGALFNPYLVTNCVFVGNSVLAASGGAIYTATNQTTIVGCAFTNNTSAATNDGGGAVSGGSEPQKQPAVLNCDFHGNCATNYGGAVLYASVSNCTFTENRAYFGSAVYASQPVVDCVFRENVAVNKPGSTGAAGACHSAPVFGCRFENCSGQYGAGISGGCVASNCTFVGCHAESAGGASYDSTMTDCLVTNCTCGALTSGAGADAGSAAAAERVLKRVTFVDCYTTASNTLTVATRAHHLVDCEFLRCNPNTPKSATNCRIVGNGVYHSIGGFQKIGTGSFTNCLVTGVSADYIFNGARLVNCTIVSNNHNSTGQLFANATRAWNCIFFDNYHSGSKHYDVAGYGDWYLTNCVFKTDPNWTAYRFHTNGTFRLTKDETFVKPTSRFYDAANPYRVAPSSLARNASTTDGVVWPDGATDLLGLPRLTEDGRSDIGCYQGWFVQDGTLLIFR